MLLNDAPRLSLSTGGAPLPSGRGVLSEFLVERLRRPVHRLAAVPQPADDPMWGDDSQLSLYLCYELHYRGLAGVDEAWEWEPSLLELRRSLEDAFQDALARRLRPTRSPVDVPDALRQLIVEASGPSLSEYMVEHGTLNEMREFAVHRSAYQLKEADPHSWAIPRLSGGPKSALVEIQHDEYGEGQPGRSHAELFAGTMVALGLEPTYGAYLDRLPGTTLATTNLVSFFGLHRRWRGALVGHLALFEMTSVTPMGRYSNALGRLGLPEGARRFYDVHVEADVHHAVVAAEDLAGGLAHAEPALAVDILFGARTVMALEERFTDHLLSSWAAGTTSLRSPL